jgi:hypothetical protein
LKARLRQTTLGRPSELRTADGRQQGDAVMLEKSRANTATICADAVVTKRNVGPSHARVSHRVVGESAIVRHDGLHATRQSPARNPLRRLQGARLVAQYAARRKSVAFPAGHLTVSTSQASARLTYRVVQWRCERDIGDVRKDLPTGRPPIEVNGKQKFEFSC